MADDLALIVAATRRTPQRAPIIRLLLVAAAVMLAVLTLLGAILVASRPFDHHGSELVAVDVDYAIWITAADGSGARAAAGSDPEWQAAPVARQLARCVLGRRPPSGGRYLRRHLRVRSEAPDGRRGPAGRPCRVIAGHDGLEPLRLAHLVGPGQPAARRGRRRGRESRAGRGRYRVA